LFNRLAGGFSHSAFVEIQFDDGPAATARHLFRALKRLGAEPDDRDGASQLSEQLKQCARGKRVLFVLDNVCKGPQLDALLPAEWGEGSVVIVTSRFKAFTDSRSQVRSLG
jgi:hypothetical protein